MGEVRSGKGATRGRARAAGTAPGRGHESARSMSWESGLGRCGAEVSAGRLRGSWWPGWGWGTGAAREGARPPSEPPPLAAVQAPGSGGPTLQCLLPPPGLRFPPPAVAEFRSSPGRPSRDPAPAALRAPRLLPIPPGATGLTWGRGPTLPTAPSSSSARQSGLGARAMAGRSGPGHRCHLRNRARRLIPGGRRRRGRSRRGAAPPAGGAGGVPRFLPQPPGASSISHLSDPGRGHWALRSGRGPVGLRSAGACHQHPAPRVPSSPQPPPPSLPQVPPSSSG